MNRSSLVLRFAAALAGAMAISFVAGQLSVAHGAASAMTPTTTAHPPGVCRLPDSAPEPDQPMEPPSPYGFNQPG